MKKAFSLIEILVVIAIIAILTTLLVPNYIESRQRAKDVQRKSDLKQMQTALELYKQNQNPQIYPLPAQIPNPCTAWQQSSIVYMNKVPHDPSSTCVSPLKYYYANTGSDTTLYEMYACLDNIGDIDAVSCPGDFSSVTSYSCGSGKCYKVTQP